MAIEVGSALEARVQEIGRELLAAAREKKSGFFARERWEEGLLSRLMESDEFRVQALRFVDVLPALRDDQELVTHVQEYFGDEGLPLPGIARWGLERAGGGLAAKVAAGAVRAAVGGLATRFIGGSDTKDAMKTVEEIRRDGMAFTLDLLGEATVSEAEAQRYAGEYRRLIEEFTPRVRRWKEEPLLDRTSGRPSPRFHLSVKVSSLYSQISAAATDQSVAALKERVRAIFLLAREKDAAICLDMEQYDLKNIVLRVFYELLEEPDLRDWPEAGIAIQAYLRDTEGDLRELVEWARRRGTPVSVRLVRGAYWDYETVVARQHEWLVPVWTEKSETDLCYERCTRLLLENHPHVETAIATHNVRSLAFAFALAEERGLRPDQFEAQMLFGMADPLKDAVAAMGRRLRVYVPFGELIPGMSYLVRRLLENTASQSFLRRGFADDLPAEVLLAAPEARPAPPAQPLEGIGFQNEPVHRFTEAGERASFAAAIEDVRGRLGAEYPLWIDGRERTTSEWIRSANPARPSEIVGSVASAGAAEAEAAIAGAARAFPAWRDTPVERRAGYVLAAAELLRARRDEFSAWEVFEAGKTWREADADVTEAIDFLEYYAREAVRLGRVLPLHAPGETNDFFYEPRGVAAVIPPWNFPLAILTGMLSAAVVAGNTALLKPASQTPVIGAKLVELFREVGLPEGVVQFLPGPGSQVGELLVADPRVHLIAFTGSQAVGARILQVAAEVGPGQQHLKHVVAELGGKNAIIVDSDADVDDAVIGVVASAFGYQGQKCSACSRVIPVGSVQDLFLERLVAAADSVRIGFPEDPGNFMGPVIDRRAFESISKAVSEGKKSAKCVLERDVSHLGDGHFIGPTLFRDVPVDSALAQEEIFGPVLALMPARTFEEALEIALSTRYALTGGVYSRSPAHLDQARRAFRVGNLYLNRKCTGAVVGRQPFGGFKLSGTGSKAGGPDYLLHFLQPRTVTENTIRRGFAPDLDLAAAELGGL